MIKMQLKMQLRKQILLGKYPYTYARVSVMKSKLIQQEDYHKLVKMELNSIIKFLETETNYKKEIDELAVRYSGSDLVERALNENLVRTFEKLKRISTNEVDLLVTSFLIRWDVQNIKTIIRGKFCSAESSYVESLLVPAGTFDRAELLAMIKLDSVEKILEKSKLLDRRILEFTIKNFRDSNNTVEIEDALDKAYLARMMSLSDRIPREGAFFRKFLKDEVDIMNLKTVLRLKREGMQKETVVKHLIFSGQIFGKKKLIQMAECSGLDDVFSMLKETKFNRALKLDNLGAVNLSDIELELDKFHISHSFLHSHQNPLSIHTILSFMLAKHVEAVNIKRLVKAKQLGISQEVIENKLLVSGW